MSHMSPVLLSSSQPAALGCSVRSKSANVRSHERSAAASWNAGAPGIILSRKYSEMKLANLSGAGQGVRKLGSA